MKNKLWRIGQLLYVFIFIMALFTLIRIICLANYHAGVSGGNYTLAMMMMDKAHEFQVMSYTLGWLHCGIASVMLKIVLEK
jgi:hypothetical protein